VKEIWSIMFCMKMERMCGKTGKVHKRKRKCGEGRNCGLHGNARNGEKSLLCVRGSRGITPVILNLGIRWQYLDGFPSRPL
jgi:hypothetical protein